MIFAVIKDMPKGILLELPCPEDRLRDQLGYMGIYAPADRIRLDEVRLMASEEMYRKMIPLFSSEDTLAAVNGICNALRSADQRVYDRIKRKLEDGGYRSSGELLRDLSDNDRPKNKDYER